MTKYDREDNLSYGTPKQVANGLYIIATRNQAKAGRVETRHFRKTSTIENTHKISARSKRLAVKITDQSVKN
jgi:hypothetical protein